MFPPKISVDRAVKTLKVNPKVKLIATLPPPDARTPIKISASGRLRWFALGAYAAGVGAIAALFLQGDFSMLVMLGTTIVIFGVMLVNALYKGIFRPFNSADIIAFGIHAAARPDVFDTLDNASEALNGAPGTVAAVAKKEPLEIFVQCRAGQILHGQLTTTQFIAPFFTCVRFRIFSDTPKQQWLNPTRQMLLLPDNIDAEEFRQCRVLLRWT